MNPKNTALYFALGEYYVKQAVLSLVSLLLVYGRSRPGFNIIVLTDMPERFAWLKTRLPLDARLLPRDQIPELSGPHGFLLRAKIAVMAEIHAEICSNLLFIDTDTILRGRLENIFRGMANGECFLHKREWPLQKGRKLHPELCPQDLDFALESATKIQITGETEMWNSGVVGIPTFRGDLLRDALDLCDQYYKIYPGWHVEQFSLSIILQATGRLRGCRREVFHYWHSKNLAQEMILNSRNTFVLKEESNAGLGVNTDQIERFVIRARIKYYIHKIRVILRKNRSIYRIYRILKRQ